MIVFTYILQALWKDRIFSDPNKKHRRRPLKVQTYLHQRKFDKLDSGGKYVLGNTDDIACHLQLLELPGMNLYE